MQTDKTDSRRRVIPAARPQQNDSRLDIAEEKKVIARNPSRSANLKFISVLLLMLGGIALLRKLFQIEPKSASSPDFIDSTIPLAPSLRTKVQDNEPLCESFGSSLIPGNLSYAQIDQLLACPQITIVENGPGAGGKSSPDRLAKKSRQLKDILHTGIADSSKIAQAAAINCLKHPTIKLEMLELPHEMKSGSLFRKTPNPLQGYFHATNATVYFYQSKLPYQVVAHELAHCGAAAMHTRGRRLPYAQELIARDFPCMDDDFLIEAQRELQKNILNHRGILEESDDNILKLAEHEPELHNLLEAAKHFNPTFFALIEKRVFSRLQAKPDWRRGGTIQSAVSSFLPILDTLSKDMRDYYAKKASNSPVKILFVDEYFSGAPDHVVIIGTPTELSTTVRVKLLVLEADAVMKKTKSYPVSGHCVEFFAFSLSAFADDVFRLLLPNSYEKLLYLIEHSTKPVMRTDYKDRDDRIEDSLSIGPSL